MSETPLVSVWMITYGHENYISQAIEGVLFQKCDFNVELIIADDCSPDNTETVVKGIIKNDPRAHIIRYTRHVVNKGMINNFIWTLEQCKGKYIAMCEGDDYWTDPLKLQKQVDFLEGHPNYSMSLHNSWILKRNKKREFILKNLHENKVFTTEEVICGQARIITHSLVFKKEYLNLPPWFNYVQQGDLALMLILSMVGPIYFFSDVMGVYRKHPTSLGALSSAVRTDLYKRDLLSYFDLYTNFKYHSIITQRKQHYQKQLYYQYLKTSGKFRKYLNLDYYVYKLKHFHTKFSK
jgi:glycosyltransferase involved in cell wall biosynthesis